MIPAADLHGLRLRFTLDMRSDAELGEFPGTVIRGALAAHLRRLVCVTAMPSCVGCAFQAACAYHRLFEVQSRPGDGDPTGFEDAPKPFILHYPTPIDTRPRTGHPFRFDVVLLGDASACAPHVIHAVRRLEDAGLGYGFRDGQGRFRLARTVAMARGGETLVFTHEESMVRPLPEPSPVAALVDDAGEYDPPPASIRLLTPLRLRRQGRWLNAHDLQFEHLVEALLRRIGVLGRFYGRPAGDDSSLLEAARGVRIVRRRLSWRAQQRYSHRQKQTMPMDGLVGAFDLEGDLVPLLPLLRLGTLLHAGKGATMGMGQFGLASNE
jgi:hypothetical protein